MGSWWSVRRAHVFAGICTVVLLAACGSGGSSAGDVSASKDRVVFAASGSEAASTGDLERSADVMMRRLRRLGVQDVSVAVDGQQLVATGTGISPALANAVSNGRLELRPVLALITPMSADAAGGEVLPNRPSDDANVKYSVGPVALTGADISTAKAFQMDEQDSSTRDWAVSVKLTESGTKTFNQLAALLYPKEPPQNAVAIVLDGVVQSAPAFMTANFQGGEVQISGSYSEGEAKELAAVLESGPLPITLKVVST